MSAENDICSPTKRRRMEITTTTSPQTAPGTNVTSTITTALTPATRTASATSGFASNREGPGLEGCQKDSIIAHILAGTEGDFGEPSFCPPGVFFDEGSYTSGASDTPGSFTTNDTWTRGPVPQSGAMTPNVTKKMRSLLICMESRGCSLQHNIEQVVADHELITCTVSEAVTLCNEQVFQLIWLQLPCPPSEDILGVITGIRYSSKLNRKTVQLGVTVTHPEIDLNLHGIDEILLEPVSKATIRQKYFDWTSVKLTPDCEMNVRELPASPSTPESSVSTESTIELSLSSLASDTTNDSGIQAEVDVVDLKPPPPFLYPAHQSASLNSSSKASKLKPSNDRPTTPPSWCRVEHATKEKHRRERIKDSCDQLRVLLPYVRGRKTDMASILEMTVDYLKIVNSNLPQEFHAHALDVMSNAGNSPPTRSANAPFACGRGTRGGRGRGTKRGSTSPPRFQDTLESSRPGRMLTRALSRGTMSSPVCSVLSRGNGGARGGKVPKRGSQPGKVMSLGSQGLSSLYLAEGKDRATGVQREESVISNTMTMPTYLQPSHYTTPHMFSDTPATSSSATSASTHTFSPTPVHGSLSTSSSDCGLHVPRLYASAHLTVEPSFLSHGPMGTPAPLGPPLPSRYGLGSERDSGPASVLPGSFGDTSTPAYYHYFSNVPDISPAYTVAGGGGGACGSGEFMSSTLFHPLPSSSAFTPTRLQLAPSRGKGELPPPPAMESGDGTMYGLMDTTPKTTK